MAECRASGLTAKAWCEAKDINYQRYVTWASKLNKEGQHKPQQWADVKMEREERATSG
ncbi:IS66 family insertion sequence element accessory protein TnpA [Desulfosporosinus shakirovi]|uniref:IS66 family insertion sequence element accessory protein TnpA n=1 Tax=Desulfosporosinus shakirovi TaxID=2885154 RepID=UPI001E323433|nr:hypothetical protein [Desulfosporosinus sp. SRJS8]MCB8815821.1 hypothetical protein [Desulfosporosinus sp. SRJS8]